ncbi:hypothetical protein EBU99_04300 [bacterium]|nr:hypothetical protein [bacterium]
MSKTSPMTSPSRIQVTSQIVNHFRVVRRRSVTPLCVSEGQIDSVTGSFSCVGALCKKIAMGFLDRSAVIDQ